MDLDMIQLDIKTAFLNRVLEEEIYMQESEGFVLPAREEEVGRLRKCLYCLKQASKWQDKKLYVNQPDFVKKILRRYNMSECNPVSIPADPNNRPSPKMSPKTEEERHQMQKTPMREAIGSLMY